MSTDSKGYNIINLSDRQLSDLEQILIGGFAPLDGFLAKEEYDSVLKDMKLSDGSFWPMPVVLDIPSTYNVHIGEKVVLADVYGNPIAEMEVQSIYKPDKDFEAQQVYGTTDTTHPGVRYLFERTESVYAGGPVTEIQLPARYDFSDLRKTPEELRAYFKQNGMERIVGFQTRNPVHRAHFSAMEYARDLVDGHVLLHPVVGQTKEGDIDYVTRVRSYKRLHEKYMKEWSTLSLLELAMRMAGPREALWHACIRKNYGCTHFVVSRDHAGPGLSANGKPFYEMYEAQECALLYAEDIGIEIIAPKEMVYVPTRTFFVSKNEVHKGEQTTTLSGTEFRKMLKEGKAIPEWFSFPEVIEELQKGAHRKERGFCLFLTGLSGAGKSTVANIVATKLRELQDKNITILDGDVVRTHLSKGLGFSKEDRDTNIERIGFVASEIVKHGGISVCSAIAPYRGARQRNRRLVETHGAYIEVYVATPLAECKRRDTKGLYEKAKRGIIRNFTGVDDPYEAPEHSEITLETVGCTPEQSAKQVLSFLKTNGYI